jgi:hypothetical protein
MKNNKYVSLVLLAVCSAHSFVSNATPCEDWCGYALDIEFRGSALKPSANNIYYAVEAFPFNNAIATPVASPRWQVYDLHPKYHFGFELGLRAVSKERGSSLGVNWQHFKSSTGASHTTASTDMIGPFSSIGPDQEGYINGKGCVRFKFDQVNVLFGQGVTFGCADDLKAELFAGVSYARIQQCLTSTYSNADGTIARSYITPSSFKGAGPELGLNFDYALCGGFNFTGHIASAFYVGNVKNHSEYLSLSPMLVASGNPNPNKQSTTTDKRLQVVPSLEERMGLSYSCASFCNCYQFTIEVGYEAQVLFNALQSTDFSSGVVGVPPADSEIGLFARTFRRTLGNFALAGPYVALGIEF